MRPLCEIRGRAHGEPKARCDETKPIASPNSFMVSYVIIYMTLLLHTHRTDTRPLLSHKQFCNVNANASDVWRFNDN